MQNYTASINSLLYLNLFYQRAFGPNDLFSLWSLPLLASKMRKIQYFDSIYSTDYLLGVGSQVSF